MRGAGLSDATVSFRGRPPGAVGKLFITFFFLIFFVAGTLFTVLVLRGAWRDAQVRSWPAVPCTITRSEVAIRDGSESPYVWQGGYAYVYGGHQYVGHDYQRGYGGSGNYADAERLARKYPVGGSSVCLVNPADPAQSVLEAKSPWVARLGLFSLIFVAIGVIGIWATWRKKGNGASAAISLRAVSSTQWPGKKGRFGAAIAFSVFEPAKVRR